MVTTKLLKSKAEQGGAELVPVVGLSLDSDQVIEHDDVSLQKKEANRHRTYHDERRIN